MLIQFYHVDEFFSTPNSQLYDNRSHNRMLDLLKFQSHGESILQMDFTLRIFHNGTDLNLPLATDVANYPYLPSTL